LVKGYDEGNAKLRQAQQEDPHTLQALREAHIPPEQEEVLGLRFRNSWHGQAAPLRVADEACHQE
jgi:hypothetical protein